MPEYPPFGLDKDLYDQATLSGRIKHFYSITDFRTLFTTKAQVEHAKTLLEQYRTNSLPSNVTNADLWNAKRVTSSVLHPVTQEPIPALFRFGAYAPMNVFIVTMMILPSTINSIPQTMFIHWFNQSYNCAVNFANRSGESAGEEPKNNTSEIIQGYVASVAASFSIALGATYISRRTANLGPRVQTVIRATLPFTAVVLAGCTNILLMRRHELTQGVPMFDHENKIHGESPTAGKIGLAKCCSARFLWNVPGMVLPGFVLGSLSTTKFWRNTLGKRSRIAFEATFIAICLCIGVPPALALFPQVDSLPVSKLEPQFQNLKDSKGQPITQLYYNKGL